MRLIDAEWLIDLYQGFEGLDTPVNAVVQNIKDAPTVDAVEVVRCKECKYNINNARAYNDDDTVACFGWCELFMTHYGEDAYCSFGKRAER